MLDHPQGLQTQIQGLLAKHNSANRCSWWFTGTMLRIKKKKETVFSPEGNCDYKQQVCVVVWPNPRLGVCG